MFIKEYSVSMYSTYNEINVSRLTVLIKVLKGGSHDILNVSHDF